MVFMRKISDKWCLCVDFTNLNVACATNLYPLPNVYLLIDGSLGYKTWSFLDAYSEYNKINMDPFDVPKISFMSNHGNYYYDVMPFELKNVSSTYQMIMGIVFSKHI